MAGQGRMTGINMVTVVWAGDALTEEAIGSAIGEVQAVINIPYAVAALGLCDVARRGRIKISVKGGGIHADTVISDDNPYSVFPAAGGNGQRAASFRFLKNAVDNRILYEGLQDDFYDLAVLHFFLNVPFYVNPILKAHVLYLDIQTCMLQLIFDGNNLPAPAQG